MSEATPIFIEGPRGRLEAVIKRCPGARAAAVVCHSHPLYGGSLHDKVVYRAARALFGMGLTVLRFNFRGVGASEGAFDGAIDGNCGEREDVRAALDGLAGDHDELVVAGYSFGAWVGLAAGVRDPRVRRLIGLGLPLRALDFTYLHDCPKPLLVIQGSRDEWGDVAAARALCKAAGPRARLVEVAGAGHRFGSELDALAHILAS